MRNPFVNFLSRLSVGRKLVLIYLLDLTAVIFVSSILINEKYIAINFARDEFRGNAYVAVLRDALVDLALVGTGGATESRKALPARAQALSDVEQRLGEGMGSLELNVALVKRLGEVIAGSGTPSGTSDLEVVSKALGAGRELVTRVGNQSKLILDPDLDSYYTMSLIVLRYPELLELVNSTGAHLRRLGEAGQARGSDARTQYLILEGRLDAAAKGIESDFAEAIAAGGPEMKENLTPNQLKLAAGFDAFRLAARNVNEIGPRPTAMADLDAKQRELLWQLRDTWTRSCAELDRLLQVRIDGLFSRMWLHLSTALFLLMGILTIVYFVARQIIVPLRRLSGVVDTVSRTGDHTLRARWQSQDEIGFLVIGFNDMLAQLDREREIQKELAASARAAEAQKALVESMPIPLVVTSVPGHEVLHANQPAKEWLAGCTSDPWAAGMEAGVRARFFQQLADYGAVDDFEVHWKANGVLAWALLSARQLKYQGQAAVLTAFGPINRLKLMEQRLELWAKVFEASSEGIVIVHADELILSVNRAFIQTTGYNQREVIGRPPEFLVDGRDNAPFFRSLWGTVRQRGTWQGEVQMRRQDGTYFPAWLMISAVYEAQGKVANYVCSSIDISDRKQVETFRTAKEAAEAASRAKSEFVANMSHELRTPMNGVLGMAELLLDTSLDDTQRRYAQNVRSSGESLLHIIDDILDFSKIEAGKMEIEVIDLNVRQTTEEAVELLSRHAQAKGLQLQCQIANNVPAVVAGDPGRLRQVLVNLVGNAVKFTEQGKVLVKVDCVSVPSRVRGCTLQFSVKDTGIGIAADAQNRLFKAFSQADGSMTRRFGGTGLGLMICKQLVTLMGGEIGVLSEPGRGSDFRFTIRTDRIITPAGIIAGETASNGAARRSGEADASEFHGARVLLAEDNPVNREVAVAILQRAGCSVTIALNGRSATEKSREQAFDLILMDCQMPEMDGFEATREIRSSEAETRTGADTRVPIVALTANAMEGDRERCIEAGMDDYLSKPFQRNDLIEVVRRWMDPASRPRAVPVPASLPASTPMGAEGREEVRGSNGAFDAEALLHLLPEGMTVDSPLVRELIRLFVMEAGQLLAELESAEGATDIDAYLRVSHTLKSSGATVGARAFAALARELEALARAGESELLAACAARLREEYWRYRDDASIRDLLQPAADVLNTG